MGLGKDGVNELRTEEKFHCYPKYHFSPFWVWFLSCPQCLVPPKRGVNDGW